MIRNQEASKRLRDALNIHCQELLTRPLVLGMAVATYAARAIPLLPEPVGDIRLYVMDHHLEDINRILSCVNEISVIDMEKTSTLLQNLLSVRYATFFPSNDHAPLRGCYIGAFTGADRFLSEPVAEALQLHCEAIYKLIPYIDEVVSV